MQATKLGLGALAIRLGVAAQAAPVIQGIAMVGANPRLAIQSDVGGVNEIQYSTDLSQTNWTALTNLVVAVSPYWIVDVVVPPVPQRFYRVVAFPTYNPALTNMALIPAGSFYMGDALDGMSDAPFHSITVSGFYMEKSHVTFARWNVVYQYALQNGYSFITSGSSKDSNHPVQSVTWFDAVKWCNARSQFEGRTPAYYTDAGLTMVYKTGQVVTLVNWSANGYWLPTEAEWEKAARGGLDYKRFPWGDTISHSQANYYSSSNYGYDTSPTRGFHPTYFVGFAPYTGPVASFAPNGYDLNDMAGNVFDWCWDWYDATYYGSSPDTDPQGPGSGDSRVLRGGAYGNFATRARCASRTFVTPTNAADNWGFRCVRGL